LPDIVILWSFFNGHIVLQKLMPDERGSLYGFSVSSREWHLHNLQCPEHSAHTS